MSYGRGKESVTAPVLFGRKFLGRSPRKRSRPRSESEKIFKFITVPAVFINKKSGAKIKTANDAGSSVSRKERPIPDRFTLSQGEKRHPKMSHFRSGRNSSSHPSGIPAKAPRNRPVILNRATAPSPTSLNELPLETLTLQA